MDRTHEFLLQGYSQVKDQGKKPDQGMGLGLCPGQGVVMEWESNYGIKEHPLPAFLVLFFFLQPESCVCECMCAYTVKCT